LDGLINYKKKDKLDFILVFNYFLYSFKKSSGGFMNIESDQKSEFNYEEWISRLFQYIKTAQHIFIGFTQTIKTKIKRGFIEVWKEIRPFASKLSAADFFFAGINIMAGVFGIIFIMAGVGLLSYQLLLWLQTGIWTEYPLLAIFNFLFENTALQQWMGSPESWIGMQKLFLWFLESIPVSLALIIPGLSIAFSASVIFFIALVLRFYQLKKV